MLIAFDDRPQSNMTEKHCMSARQKVIRMLIWEITQHAESCL